MVHVSEVHETEFLFLLETEETKKTGIATKDQFLIKFYS